MDKILANLELAIFLTALVIGSAVILCEWWTGYGDSEEQDIDEIDHDGVW